MNTTATNERIISRTQFRVLTGISRTTEWRLAQEGKLPPLVVVAGRTLGYRESEYQKWLSANQQAA